MPVCSIDTETFWDKKRGISLTTLGHYKYIRHPEFECFLVSIHTDTGLTWVGHPKDAPWDQISGPEWTWITPHAAFDEDVLEFLRETGVVPEWAKPGVWECLCDMVAWMGYPRSLASACEYLLGEKIDKSTRDNSSGLHWHEMSADFKAQMTEYARIDAVKPLEIWQKYSHLWPEWERRVARLTRAQVKRGVYIDRPLLENYIGDLQVLLWKADQQIPWRDTGAALSYPMLVAECRKVGIAPPPSLAMTDDACAEWEETYGDKFPWVDAMRTKRRANTLLQKLQTLEGLIRPDGRASMPLKYCGASTRRFSGGYSDNNRRSSKDKGFNPQNLPSKPMLGEEMVRYGVKPEPDIADPEEKKKAIAALGVDLRRCLAAPEGKLLCPVDLSQIEPRLTLKICGDEKTLQVIREGMEIYEAHARLTMGYDRPEPLAVMAKKEPHYLKIRKTSKARVIGLGYQCGKDRFVEVAKQMADLVISPEEAEQIVNDFRRKNKKITDMWEKLQRALEASIGDDLTLTLPSGNKLVYRDVKREQVKRKDRNGKEYVKTEIKASVCKNTPQGEKMCRVSLYGGKLLENLIQSIARDLFCLGMLALDDAGYPIVLQTHDEAVPEIPETTPAAEIARLMTQPPAWMPDIPLAASAEPCKAYEK